MIIDRGCDLFQRIQDSGFDIRKYKGRDNALYLKLQSKLGCPVGVGLYRYLKEKEVPADRFLEAFLIIAEPFSLMYQFIYAEMKKYKATGATEFIQIRIESKDAKFTIDLSDFERWYRIHRMIRQRIRARIWSERDFWQLTDFLGMLGGQWNPNMRFELNDLIQVTEPPENIDSSLIEALRVVQGLLQTTADEIVATNSQSDDSDLIMALQSESQDLGDDRFSASFIYETFPAVLRRYEDLINRINTGRWNKDRIPQALTFFGQLYNNLGEKIIQVDENVDLLEKILELPFWRYRWYVYEVWVTLLSAVPLSEFGFNPVLLKGQVLTLALGKESEVGYFIDSNENEYVLAAQVTSKIPGMLHGLTQKKICPDIRIASRPVSSPENTIMIIECKQRISMNEKELTKNVLIYEKGAPRSQKNIFVNYDSFPSIQDHPRTQIVSLCNPQNPKAILQFQSLIRDALSKEGILPPKEPFHAILIDVSGSMQNEYEDDQIQNQLSSFLDENPGCKVFFFDVDLIDIDRSKMGSVAQSIQSQIGGGTNLKCTLKSLHKLYPSAVNIVVLTDGRYGIVPEELRHKFQIVESFPNQIANTPELWK